MREYYVRYLGIDKYIYMEIRKFNFTLTEISIGFLFLYLQRFGLTFIGVFSTDIVRNPTY